MKTYFVGLGAVLDEKLKNKFVIVNPMFNGISHKNYIKEKYHHFALLEGYQFAKYLPKKIFMFGTRYK